MTTIMASSSSPSAFLRSPPSNFSSRAQPLSVPRVTITSSLFAKKTPLNLSFSHSISTFAPLVLNRSASPAIKISQPLTVVCAKGYKMKTHKASAKRFRVTGSGKIMRRRAGKQHLLGKKNTKRKLRLSKMVQVDRSDYNNVIGAMPYLKVNRAN